MSASPPAHSLVQPEISDLRAVEPVDKVAADVVPAIPAASALLEIPIPDLREIKNPKVRAEFLLHTAAEIEHALMVQYLYASFSLGPPFEQPQTVPSNGIGRANRWRRSLLSIAREEMGHLITVQNLLRLIGGTLNFEREDFPFRRDYYPFPFTLEPLSTVSLAKYVAAERPEEVDPALQEIIDLATEGAGMTINRVGVIYALLTSILSRREDVETAAATGDEWDKWVGTIDRIANVDFQQNEQHLRDEDFVQTSGPRQAQAVDWGGDLQLFVRVVQNRQQALEALREIAIQGEGLPPGQSAATDSHFERLKEIFDLFPRAGEWRPARSVGVNPSLPQIGSEPTAVTITNVRSQRWAELFNLRYEILLTSLIHFLESEGPLYVTEGETKGDRTARGYLHIWTFDEMRRIFKIGTKLSQLPRHDPADEARAGAPFTLPATLDLPAGESARWQKHSECFAQCLRMLDEMLQPGSGNEDDPFLSALRASDETSLAISQTQVAGESLPLQPVEFKKVVRILDEAVRGLRVGSHGGFWRDVTLQTFIEQRIAVPVLGLELELLVVGDGQESNLVKVLNGDLQSQGVPRMPDLRPPVPAARIEYIKEWIDRGCPDNDPPGEVGLAAEPDPNAEPPPT